MNGPHTGISLAWKVWESLSKRGIINRLYSLTGDNAANNLAMMNQLQKNIKEVQKQSGYVSKKGKVRPLNQATLETQDKSSELQLINNHLLREHEEEVQMELGPVICPPAERTIVRQLRELFSQIHRSAKQRELFIQARNKTRDPKLLPINIPMIRWSYFLKQIQRAHQLKLSIQTYISSLQNMEYQLSKEAWCAMEYMEPILSMFEKTCNIFQ
ncbi:hypothetical protein O181_005520 [Austropuccinia psidii MF-1]|uniref:Uncharacterized protein n=1 Tax=Austropuccinia psidii MF-1 TaxID=1389203 RepID=A0A9Q3GFX5_9BASI|nr:hypothetical protein [Austropuccinia psidii MF-1]